MAIDPQIYTNVAVALAAGWSAYQSHRSSHSARKIERQWEGAPDEPNMRALIQQTQEAQLVSHNNLHTDLVRVNDRLTTVEKTMATAIESRLSNLETDRATTKLITTAVGSLSEQVTQLIDENGRNGLNIHLLANKMTPAVALLSPEQAKIEMAKKSKRPDQQFPNAANAEE